MREASLSLPALTLTLTPTPTLTLSWRAAECRHPTQAVRRWARPPCRHIKIQYCCFLGSGSRLQSQGSMFQEAMEVQMPLHNAAADGDVVNIRRLVAEGADVNLLCDCIIHGTAPAVHGRRRGTVANRGGDRSGAVQATATGLDGRASRCTARQRHAVRPHQRTVQGARPPSPLTTSHRRHTGVAERMVLPNRRGVHTGDADGVCVGRAAAARGGAHLGPQL